MKRQAGSAPFAMLLASLLASAACSRREPPPPPPPKPLDVDRELLEEAMHQCFTVNCDAAHARAAEISADSPLRQTDAFKAIEYRYQVNQLLYAQGQPDIEKRRDLLDAFRGRPEIEAGLRVAAAEELGRIGGGKTFELKLAGVPKTTSDGGAEAGSNEDGDKIAALMRSKKPADYQLARSLIEPKLYAGHASPDDVRAMTTICKAQKDQACLKTLKTLKLR